MHRIYEFNKGADGASREEPYESDGDYHRDVRNNFGKTPRDPKDFGKKALTGTGLEIISADAGTGNKPNRIHKPSPARTDEAAVEEVPTNNKKGEELKAELDDLLDEIDEVLEENAEEFVRSYVQKGGE